MLLAAVVLFLATLTVELLHAGPAENSPEVMPSEYGTTLVGQKIFVTIGHIGLFPAAEGTLWMVSTLAANTTSSNNVIEYIQFAQAAHSGKQ